MAKEIPLTKGKVAIVDDEDYEWLSQWKWHIKNEKYAARDCRINGKKVTIYMHRAVIDAPDDMMVDHINHNTLDNRKENLRLATNGQNQRNGKPKRKYKKYKGVRVHPPYQRQKRFQAVIYVDGKNLSLGYYQTEEEAAEAYNKAALFYYGEFAYLNQIEGKDDVNG